MMVSLYWISTAASWEQTSHRWPNPKMLNYPKGQIQAIEPYRHELTPPSLLRNEANSEIHS